MSKRFKTIIVDDEYPARLMMKELISKHLDLIEVIGEAENGKSAIKLINSLKPDLIFLDIQMPDMEAFTMLLKLNHKPMVVFTTAYEQYAIKAFEEHAVDYLLKPIEDARFDKCIVKLRHFVNATPQVIDFNSLKQFFDHLQPKKMITAIPIKIKDKIILVRLSKISYLLAEQGYVIIYTDNGEKFLTELTLSELEDKLPSNFLRVQRSYIINTEKILEINRYFNNRLIILMNDSNDTKIISGTTYINQIRLALDL
ncbi:response regulator [Pedobacter sp. HDW13]|uniref:LytR/AlgR family response regulator transcription factor n=1 Tax=Pedobacter sp. HDW13 TaxID=2714940 RepID=UPI001409D445|nr:LytTR family transcriptional regulator DNA-binding domain-containing protein [Pedobacter sp. HDW13]QIL41254.1 response regulator [Pedobacter sp. HDW13]